MRLTGNLVATFITAQTGLHLPCVNVLRSKDAQYQVASNVYLWDRLVGPVVTASAS